MRQGICSACGRYIGLIVTYGLCDRDYRRLRKHGDPLIVLPPGGIHPEPAVRFEAKVDRSGGPDACHPWLAALDPNTGYGRFNINGRTRLAHAVAWEFVNGPVPPGRELDHECHNRAVRAGLCHPGLCPHRLCCNERHLVPKTRREHTDDTECRRGSAIPQAKLTEADIPRIWAALAAGESQVSIARRYRVNPMVISDIVRGKTWRHVTIGVAMRPARRVRTGLR